MLNTLERSVWSLGECSRRSSPSLWCASILFPLTIVASANHIQVDQEVGTTSCGSLGSASPLPSWEASLS